MRLAVVFSVVLSSLALVLPVRSAEAAITFQGASIDLSEAPGDGIQAIAVADLNHDNRADLIVVQPDTGDISVFLNSGSGSFNAPTVLSSDLSPIAVTTGDFDNDGNVDMAVVNDDNTVTTYLGDGAGNFPEPGNNYPVCPDDAVADGVVAADFDGDLQDDLAVLCYKTVYLLRSVGAGTFAPFGTSSIDTRSYGNFAIAAGRIYSHNFVDLAVSSADTHSVSVFRGNNDGTFQSQAPIQSGLSSPQGLTIGQFYGDNNPDIAVISGIDTYTTVDILAGNGAGGFTVEDTTSTSSAEAGSVAIVAVDLDGDGKTDLAVGSSDPNDPSSGLIGLFCQQPSTVCYDGVNTIAAGFEIEGVLTVLSGPVTALQSGDLNGDGRPDLVGVNSYSDTIKILLNTTGLAQPTTPPASPGTSTPPLASPTPTGPTPTRTPTFTPQPTATPTPIPQPYGVCNIPLPTATAASKPVAVVTGDFNHDRKQDIAVADGGNDRVVLFESGTSQAPGMSGACTGVGIAAANDLHVANPVALAAGLLDKTDQNLDLAVAGSSGVSIFLGNDQGGFGSAVTYWLADQNTSDSATPGRLAIADINHDGAKDVLVTNTRTNNVSLLLGKSDGSGAFCSACAIPVGMQTSSVVVRDFNGDGFPDFAVVGDQLQFVVFLQTPATPATGGSCPSCPAFTGFTRNLSQFPRGLAADLFDLSDTVPDLAIAMSASVSSAGTSTPTPTLKADGSMVVFLGKQPTPGGRVIFEGQSSMSVPRPNGSNLPSVPSALIAAKVNRGALSDVIVADANNSDVVIFYATGGGAFNALRPVPVGATPVDLASGDLDGDGTPDVVTANSGDGSISLLLSTQQPPTPKPIPTSTPTNTAVTPSATPTVSATCSPTPTQTRTRAPTAVPTPVPTETPRGKITLGGSCAIAPAEDGAGAFWALFSTGALLSGLRRWRSRYGK